jgi:hypothetical protein
MITDAPKTKQVPSLKELAGKALEKARDPMFSYDSVEHLDRGRPLSSYFKKNKSKPCHEKTLVHITSASDADFDEGIHKGTIFKRLEDCDEMKIWEYKHKVVGACAGGFNRDAENLLVYDGGKFQNKSYTSSSFDKGVFYEKFEDYQESSGPEYKTKDNMPKTDFRIIRVDDWRTKENWFLTKNEKRKLRRKRAQGKKKSTGAECQQQQDRGLEEAPAINGDGVSHSEWPRI